MPDRLLTQLQLALGAAYTLERELEAGGMSRVFVAREVALERDVVVKVLSPDLAAVLSVDRFAREIKVAARLQDPHIVPLLAAGVTAEGLPYFTMPFVRGESLRTRLARGPVPLAESMSVLHDVAKALAYAHAQGIVHRDIKPENVLLSSRTAVVTDFGIAKALQRARTLAPDEPSATGHTGLTQLGASIGTPAYMAPEQAAGDAVDQRADLYAWGVLAYEMLAGAHPFADRITSQQLMAAHISESPVPLPERASGAPRALAALVMRCLAKRPDERPAHAGELLTLLDAVGTGETRVPAPRTLWRTRMLSAAAVLLLIAGAASAAWRSRGTGVADAASVAVLPFESRGASEQQFFADGLTDAVTGRLVGVSGLMVIDRRSAATYKGTTKPAAQIGRELGVAYLLEGVITWAKDPTGQWRAQIVPTLVRTRDGATQWSGEPLVITPTDPFSAQAEIATRVVSAIGVALGPKEQALLKSVPTKNAEAYALYLRGRLLDHNRMIYPNPFDTVTTAAPLLERATKLDPSFALAFAELARVEFYRRTIDSTAFGRARAALRAALAIDSELPEAHLVHAIHLCYGEGRCQEAVVAASRASARRPGDAEMLAELGGMQVTIGQVAEGAANIERSTMLDPLDEVANGFAVTQSWRQHRLADAERHARRMVAVAPERWAGYGWLIAIALARGDTTAARATLEAARRSTTGVRENSIGIFWLLPRPLAEAMGRPDSDNDQPDFDRLAYYSVLGAWARETGDPARARIYFDSGAQASRTLKYSLTGHGTNVATLAAGQAVVYAGSNRPAEARRAIAYMDSVARLNALPNDPRMASAQDRVAYALLLLGDRDAAIARLERLLALPSGRTPAMLRTMWPYTSLHGDPRFEQLTQSRTVR